MLNIHSKLLCRIKMKTTIISLSHYKCKLNTSIHKQKENGKYNYYDFIFAHKVELKK